MAESHSKNKSGLSAYALSAIILRSRAAASYWAWLGLAWLASIPMYRCERPSVELLSSEKVPALRLHNATKNNKKTTNNHADIDR